MKSRTKNLTDTDKSTPSEIGGNEPHVMENVIKASANVAGNKPSVDAMNSAKKDINYILQLNITKKKLETIQKKIEGLYDKAQEKDNILHEKYNLITFHQEQVYLTDMEYQKQLSVLQQNLKLYNISNIKIITDAQTREKFLSEHKKAYLKDVILPFLEKSKDLPEEKKEELQYNLLNQETQRVEQLLEQLHASYLNVVVEQELLNEKKKQFDLLKQEITALQTEYAKIQESIVAEQKKFDEVNIHGLLKAYEVSGVKIPIDEFISNPVVEEQMKKLIAIFNNPSEAKKFGLSLPKGILFVGEPETGKTFAAKVLASEIDRKMYHIRAHDLFSETSTDPNQMLYILFYTIIDHVQKNKESCIIFLDEIEKIIDSMGEYNPAEQKMISNTILKNVINIQKSNLDIIVVAALSHKNKIDPRFMKYDIFDNQFYFELPQAEERKQLFQLYISKAEKRAKLKIFDPAIIDDMVKKTDGLSAELIKQLINSCVKEYLYMYLNAKPSFDITIESLPDIIAKINESKDANLSKKDVVSREERQKIVSAFMSRRMVFGSLENKEKAHEIRNHILDQTDTYTEEDMTALMNLLFSEYQRKKSDYHRQSLIQKDFVMDKIQQLRSEERRKGSGFYFSTK